VGILDYFSDLARASAQRDLDRQRIMSEQTRAFADQFTPSQAQAAYLAGSMAPTAAAIDAAGQMAPFPPADLPLEQLPQYMQSAQPMPSMQQNFQQGNYLDASLQGVGLLGDALSLAGIGVPLKALSKTAQAMRKSTSLLEPSDVPRLQFTGDSAPQQLAEGTSRQFSTTGKYRGAPADINSPAKLAAMQRKLRDYAEKGADYRLWYEQTNDAIKQQTAGRPGRQDQYAATAAITSQGTSVPANATMAMKGYNQAIVGDDIATGRFPNTMGPAIQDVFSGASPPLGPKR
jgi:hypothetical protein